MATKAHIAKSKRSPKFSVRQVHRCARCGRTRGYLRDFNLCRICMREMAHQGFLPGIRKSSW
jgi:small subunit ribosomal protein S14